MPDTSALPRPHKEGSRSKPYARARRHRLKAFLAALAALARLARREP